MAGRFQFSIRFLLVATVAVAAGAATARLEMSRQAAVATDSLTVLFATGAIVGVLQTSGKLRTFWIGVSVVLGLAMILAAISLWTSIMYEEAAMAGVYPASSKLATLWRAAPLNGLFAVVLHWLFSPRGDAARFPGTALVTMLLVLLAATFFGGMRFGELRESDRRDRAEQAERAGVNEEMENLDE